jgi:hypothetical protein
MRDVTDILQSYRECVRHLWNAHFLHLLPATRDQWGLRDQFDDACSILFGALVVDRIGVSPAADAAHILSPSRRPSSPPLAWLHVVPLVDCRVRIMINRDATADGGYWDHPVKRVLSQDVELRLVHLYDFGELQFRDFKYYLVRIISSRIEGLAGRAALIESEYARVFVDEEAFTNEGKAP